MPAIRHGRPAIRHFALSLTLGSTLPGPKIAPTLVVLTNNNLFQEYMQTRIKKI